MNIKGTKNDKLLAVLPDSHFASIKNIEELNDKFPGVTSIIETWFKNYKGPGIVQIQGFGSVQENNQLLNSARKAYFSSYVYNY